MKNILLTLSIVMTLAFAATALAETPKEIIAGYSQGGKLGFSAEQGKTLWYKKSKSDEGDERECSTCHNKDFTKAGKHAKSGKVIDPMSITANKERYTDPAKVEKWFTRNCKWTYGRECTPQEKGDLLTFMLQQ